MSGAQGMLIETKSASLETMAVTIQALHVNGKQMTLAVFRQLPVINGDRASDRWYRPPHYKPLNIEDGVAAWGVVRYSIGDDAIWLVVSMNGRLYRAPMYPNPKTYHCNNDEQVEREMTCAARDAEIISTLPQLFIAV